MGQWIEKQFSSTSKLPEGAVVDSLSGNSTVNSPSVKAVSDELKNYLPLTGGDIRGDLGVSGWLTGSTLEANRAIIGNGAVELYDTNNQGGSYIDFHKYNSNEDYDARLICKDNNLLKCFGEFSVINKNPSVLNLTRDQGDGYASAISFSNNVRNYGLIGMYDKDGLHRWHADTDYCTRFLDGINPSYRIQQKTVTIDMSPLRLYSGSDNVTALLIVAKSWVGMSNSTSMYIYSAIQGTNYAECFEIGRQTYGATVTASGYTLTINFYDNNGGGYCVYPLF